MAHSDHDHHEESPIFLPYRPRRNRASAAIRSLVRETELSPQHFILPMFVVEGRSVEEPIGAMPGVARLSIDRLVETARKAADLGIPAVALFPALPDPLKDPFARGLTMGTISHAQGTAVALQEGEEQGAMGGLAMILAGIITAALAPVAVWIVLRLPLLP